MTPPNLTAISVAFSSFRCSQLRGGSLLGASLCPRFSNSGTNSYPTIQAEYLQMIDMFIQVNGGLDVKNMLIAKSIKDFAFQLKHIAGDCFHPSEEGQSDIAEITFKEASELLKMSL